jgi:hypothetical protein
LWLRCFPLSSIAVAVLCLTLTSGARAADQAITDTHPCGADAHQAIAAAEKALASKNHDNDRAAISCLIQALSAVDARLHTVETGGAAPAALIAPKGAWRNQR